MSLERLRDLFERTIEANAEQRAALLRELNEEDPELASELQAMLAADGSDSSFLTTPIETGTEDSATSDLGGRKIGSFSLVRPIASGGMGTVYEAVQKDPHRTVALKVLHTGLGGSFGLERFQREAQVLGRLNHPGIAQIYEAGVQDAEGELPLAWFAMEPVAGARTLDEYAKRERPGERRILELFLAICEAVHHGHQKGVVHRDLKPANLLIDRGGQPKVIDFGIALLTEDEGAELTRHTRTGELLGTLHYMSPEQFSGDPRAVDTRSDIYSLGVILYELLCKRLPYDLEGEPLWRVAETIQNSMPSVPKETNFPRDLVWILLKTLEKEPDRRYGSASDLALDLQRYLDGDPVLAGKPSTIYRMTKFVRRHTLGVMAAGLILFLLIAGLIGSIVALQERTVLLGKAEAGRTQAQTEAARLAEINDYLETMLRSADPWDAGRRDMRVSEVLDRAAADIDGRFDDTPEVEASLRTTLAWSYFHLGRLDRAEQQLHVARERCAPPSLDDATGLIASRLLSSTLLAKGEAEKALELAQETLESVERDFGPDHAQSAVTRSVVGHVLTEMGRFEEAQSELKRAYPNLREPGMELDLVECLIHLSTSMIQTGHAAQALDLLQSESKTMDDWVHRFRLDFVRAEALLTLRRAEEARPLLVELRKEARARFGEGSPVSNRIVIPLSRAFTQSGERQRSLEILRSEYEATQESGQGANATTTALKEALALNMTLAGQADDAVGLYAEVIDEEIEFYGPAHWRTLYTMQLLARAEAGRGNYAGAYDTLAELLDQLEPVASRNYGTVFDYALDLIDRTKSRHPDPAQVEEAAHRMIAALNKVYAPEEPFPCLARAVLALILVRQERREEAAEILEDVLDDLPRHYPNLPTTLESMFFQAKRYQEEERWQDAANLLRDLAELSAQLGSPHDESTLEVQRQRIVALRRSGREGQAAALLDELIAAAQDDPRSHQNGLRLLTELAEER